MTKFDPEAFKATTRDQWDAAAEAWNAWGPLLDRWLGPATEELMDMAGIAPGHRVLHVAGGSGQEALQSARRVGPGGRVLSTDLSERITAVARQNFAAAGLDWAEAAVADGESIEVGTAQFDAVLSRVGLIYFPDQAGALARQIAVLRPGGTVGALVYAEPEACRFFSDPVAVIRRHAGLPAPQPGQPGPFSLGAPGALEALFSGAGLEGIEVRRIEAPVLLASADECLRFERESFGALHQMLASLDDAARDAAWDDVAAALRAFETGAGFAGPCTMLAAVGVKPE